VRDQGDDPTPATLAQVLARMQTALDSLPESRPELRYFLETYHRTTAAIGTAVTQGLFEDAAWVERWDAAFAMLYLDALEGDLSGAEDVSRPWRLAFAARSSLPPLRHVLLGINAHINYDLPQALLAVISETDFAEPVVVARRRRDHERIDAVLSGRVAAEDERLESASNVTLVDRALRPVNRLASKRFLREARGKVWHNAWELQAARLLGAQDYRIRLSELEVLSAARIADLLAPGQVLLRLSITGFGVVLPPPR
jgi:hypothetical protein